MLLKVFFLDSKYSDFVKELIESEKRRHLQTQEIASSLQKYAKSTIDTKEADAWKNHLLKKHT